MIIRILPLLVFLTVASPSWGQTPLADQVQALSAQARSAPAFRIHSVGLDAYRVLAAAGVPLSDRQIREAGELAGNKGLNIEAEAALQPLAASGVVGGAADPQAVRNRRYFEVISAQAENDRSGGLKAAETEALSKDTGLAYVRLGEANLGPGNFAKAAELIGKGLARDGMTRGEIALAQLHLGIAQYRAGQIDDAQVTWSAVDADNGAAEIAKAWLAISATS